MHRKTNSKPALSKHLPKNPPFLGESCEIHRVLKSKTAILQNSLAAIPPTTSTYSFSAAPPDFKMQHSSRKQALKLKPTLQNQSSLPDSQRPLSLCHRWPTAFLNSQHSTLHPQLPPSPCHLRRFTPIINHRSSIIDCLRLPPTWHTDCISGVGVP